MRKFMAATLVRSYERSLLFASPQYFPSRFIAKWKQPLHEPFLIRDALALLLLCFTHLLQRRCLLPPCVAVVAGGARLMWRDCSSS